MMDLRQIRYFAKVAELSSFRASADALHISQPALGVAVKKLEREFDTELFTRHSRGVTLTQAGSILLKHARELLARADTVQADMRRFSRTPVGTVNIGVTPSIGRVLIPDLLEICTDRHPEIEVHITQAFELELDEAMDGGRVDMSFSQTNRESARFESLPLFLQKTCVVGAPGLVGDLRAPLPIEALSRLPLALDKRRGARNQQLETIAEHSGVKLEDVIEVRSISIRREVVLGGRRCTVAPNALFAREIDDGLLIALELDIPSLHGTLNLNTRRVEVLSLAEKAIRQVIVELVDRHIRNGVFGWTFPPGNPRDAQLL